MAYQKKTWLARLGQGLNKFIFNGGTKVTLDSSPDVVTQEGTPLSADNMNDLEDRIEAGFTDVDGAITSLTDTVDAVLPLSANHSFFTRTYSSSSTFNETFTGSLSDYKWVSVIISIDSSMVTQPLIFPTALLPVLNYGSYLASIADRNANFIGINLITATTIKVVTTRSSNNLSVRIDVYD